MKRAAIIIFVFGGCFIGFVWLGQVIPKPYIVILDQAGIVFGYLLACLSVGTAVYAILNRYQIRRWFFRKDFENSFEEFRVPPERIRGMLIPISRREQPEWILRWLRPQTVVFLYTPKTQNIARQLTEEFGEQITFPISVADIDAGKYRLENAFDPEAAYAIAQSLIQILLNRGIDTSQVFVDTTGGTVPMSIGCFQAAEEAGVSSIYVMGTQKGVIKLPQKQEHGEPIFLSDHSK